MQGAFSTLLNFIRNLDSLIIKIVLSDELFKVIMRNTSLKLLDLNKI
jgi:hypothetical protein